MLRAPAAAGRPHRRVILSLIACLLVGGGVFLGARVARRIGGGPVDSTQSHALDWISVVQSDPRIADVFETLQRKGLAASLDALERVAARDSTVLRNGHQLAHALGRRAVATRHGDPSVISQCRASFGSGCYHGVVEAVVHAHGGLEMGQLERMCLRAGSGERPGPIYECAHGLGHGVLGASGFDLDAALHHCDALSTSSFQAACHSGAFMEAINSALAPDSGRASPPGDSASAGHTAHGMHSASSGHRLLLDPNHPYSPCDRFADPYAYSCWLFQGFLILGYHRFNAAQALRTCDNAPGGWAERCYESIGHQLTGLFQHDDGWIISQCGKGRPDMAPRCIAGAAMALDQIDWSGTRAAGLCATSPSEWKELCYRSAAKNLTTLTSKTDRAQLCARIEPAYARSCREAAELLSLPAPP